MNFSEDTFDAAFDGDIKYLKYLHKNVGCEWNSEITYAAAVRGHLECLQYAHENGCSWDPSTTWGAAMGGYLDCLKYSVENGCPWDTETTLGAADNVYLECLKYCLDNNCPIDSRTLKRLDMKYWEVNLIEHLELRSILFHPRLKDDAVKIEKFKIAIEEYNNNIQIIFKLLEDSTQLLTDIIKYEILKYI